MERYPAGSQMKKWTFAVQMLLVGFYVSFSLVIPTGVGFWVDQQTPQEFPFWTFLGLALGTAIMIFGVYRMVRPYLEDAKKEGTGTPQEDHHGSPPPS